MHNQSCFIFLTFLGSSSIGGRRISDLKLSISSRINASFIHNRKSIINATLTETLEERLQVGKILWLLVEYRYSIFLLYLKFQPSVPDRPCIVLPLSLLLWGRFFHIPPVPALSRASQALVFHVLVHLTSFVPVSLFAFDVVLE